MNYKWNNLSWETIKSLSLEDKEELLELIIIDSKGKKPNSTTNKSEKKVLTRLLENAIITCSVEKDKFWESKCKKWYLNSEDYDKLLLKFDKEYIESLIERFEKWNAPAKLKRTSIYLTINRWAKDDNKFVPTKEQSELIRKSYDNYTKKAEIDNSSFAKYASKVEKLFEQGEEYEDVREYLLLEFNKQLKNSKGYRARPENLTDNYKAWKKYRK